MASYFTFVEAPHEGWADDTVEAESLEEARQKVAETLRPGDDTTIYLVPADAVTIVRAEGPKPAPKGLLKLLWESNRLTGQLYDAKHSGGYTVQVVGGSLAEPEASI